MKRAWRRCLEVFFPNNVGAQRRAGNSLRQFWRKEGDFASDLALEYARDDTVKTDDWWIENAIGEEHEEIRRMAMRILPQPTAMTAAERDWKTYDYVHSKLRNRLDPARAADLVLVNSHLQLQEKIHQ
jgi:hypothetical protein